MDMEHTYELGGKTLGMIGCGRISQLAMKKCKYGFGMKVIGYDPYLTQDKIGDLCELKETAKEVWEAGRLRVRASARRPLHRALHRP